ncbi:MAG TPA: F0F1 ATP synthase subunit B [Gemmatimonadales bacterium]
MRGFWLLLQEHGAPAQGGETHVATPFDINTGVIFWTLIVFGLLLFLLWRYAWPGILRTVEEREQRIQRQLEEAEKNRAEAARLLEEHKRLLAGGRAEAQDLIAKAKHVAEKERETLLARTRQEQEELLARARRDIDEEKQKALLALRKEAVDLAMAAAAKLIEVKLDSEADRRLVEEYLASLDKVP